MMLVRIDSCGECPAFIKFRCAIKVCGVHITSDEAKVVQPWCPLRELEANTSHLSYVDILRLDPEYEKTYQEAVEWVDALDKPKCGKCGGKGTIHGDVWHCGRGHHSCWKLEPTRENCDKCSYARPFPCPECDQGREVGNG